MQVHNDSLHPVAYASRALTKAEKNYSVTDIEALCVIWALNKFKYTIQGYSITILTDHQPLLYLFNKKDISGRLARWFLTLQQYQPEFSYIKGKMNAAADALSRSIFTGVLQCVDAISLLEHDEIYVGQRNCVAYKEIIDQLESGEQVENYYLENGILFKITELINKNQPNRTVHQLVLPSSCSKRIIEQNHDSRTAGHMSIEKTQLLIELKYFWVGMNIDIKTYVENCHVCNESKGRLHKPVEINAYPIPTQPFHTISIDLLKLPVTSNGSQYLLVAIDQFSRYSWLVPLQDKTSFSVAKALIDYIICPFQTPKNILSDNGTEFVNSIIKDLSVFFNINHATILPSKPSSNGMVERHNSKILQILRAIINPHDSEWDQYIPQVIASLNSMIHKSTCETPHFIIFGSDKRLPYDSLIQQPKPLYNLDDFAKVSINNFKLIHQRIREKLQFTQKTMIAQQHKIASPFKVQNGDIVYLINQLTTSKIDKR